MLWAAGLSTVGILPAACSSEWSLLSPRPVDWTMKPLSSARTEENVFADGHVELRIEHELLRGVTPQMLVWWWRNIEGEMEIKGQKYFRYLIWHPVDHIHFAVVKRLADGSVGVGSTFHLVEALGADMKNLIDVLLQLRRLDETGATVELDMFGRTVMRIHGDFVAESDGTRVISTMTLGGPGWLSRIGLIDWFFPAERRRAWLKHSVEEIGNLQFFLPALYARHARAGETGERMPA